MRAPKPSICLRALAAATALTVTALPGLASAGDRDSGVRIIIVDEPHRDARHGDRHGHAHPPRHERRDRFHSPGARERINRHFRHRLGTGADRGEAWRQQRIHRPRHNSRAHVPNR